MARVLWDPHPRASSPWHSSLLSRPLHMPFSLLMKHFPLSLASSLTLQSPNIVVLSHKLLCALKPRVCP